MTATTQDTDLSTTAHAALRDRIEQVRQECNRLYDAYLAAPYDAYADAERAWLRCSTRHDALIEAGILISLGPVKE